MTGNVSQSAIEKAGRFQVAKTMLKFKLGIKGERCKKCCFHEAAHYNPDIQWDMDDYPCVQFIARDKPSNK